MEPIHVKKSLVLCLAMICCSRKIPVPEAQSGARHEPKCRAIHEPKSGCPEGWTKRPAAFTEKDGTKIAGCELPRDSPGFDDCLDYLKAGESFTMNVPLPLLSPTPVRKDPVT